METDICIIGAGMAGLSAAKLLTEAGKSVVLLEKSRGLGGRAATRRIDGIPVDHGAQFFTARTDEFQKQVSRWLTEGICHEWSRGFHRWKDGTLHPPDAADANPRYACAEGLTSLAKHLAAGLDIQRECKVVQVSASGGKFTVLCDHGDSIKAGALFTSAPMPQTLEVCADLIPSEARAEVARISIVPCLAVIAETSDPAPPWKAVQISEGPLSWMGADFTKRPHPGRRFLVLHGSADFSTAHVDGDLAVAAGILASEAKRIGGFSDLQIRHTHRWRYARAASSPGSRAFLRPQTGLPFYILGDAFLGGRFESAWLSGRAAARDFLRLPPAPHQ